MGKKWTIKPQSWEPGIVYVTQAGLNKLQERYNFLLHKERPKISKEVGIAAAHGDRSENAEYQYGKKRLREIDREIYQIQKKLENVNVVPHEAFPSDKVGFGSTITMEDEEGNNKTVQIVGPDEADIKVGRISFHSPLAKAIMGKKEGDTILFHPPKGEMEYTILKIEGYIVRNNDAKKS